MSTASHKSAPLEIRRGDDDPPPAPILTLTNVFPRHNLYGVPLWTVDDYNAWAKACQQNPPGRRLEYVSSKPSNNRWSVTFAGNVEGCVWLPYCDMLITSAPPTDDAISKYKSIVYNAEDQIVNWLDKLSAPLTGSNEEKKIAGEVPVHNVTYRGGEGITFMRRVFTRLTDKGWIDDDAIDGYFRLIERR